MSVYGIIALFLAGMIAGGFITMVVITCNIIDSVKYPEPICSLTDDVCVHPEKETCKGCEIAEQEMGDKE